MRYRLLLFIVAQFYFLQAHAGDTLRALFIGNSYTFYNNMPQIVNELAMSTGDQLVHSSSTPGGYTFQQHSADPATVALIAQGNWDYVVLQEQSQLPSFPDGQVNTSVYPFAKKLDSLVKLYNPCAKTVFYMTWGRKNGDQGNCGFHPPVCTYLGMDDLLQLRYTNMADSNNAVLSPVGKVWRRLRNNNPALELFDADESHPSINGSYAAACAFYSTMFRKDPALCTYNSTINATDASTIRNAAKQTVYDSLSSWYRFYPLVAADFTYSSTGSVVVFTNASVNATDYIWDFGDGNTATTQNTAHTYAANGTYQVKLVSKKCKDADTETKTIQLNTVGINELNTIDVKVFPNPAFDKLHIRAKHTINATTVYDVTGKTIVTEHFNTSTATLNIEQLPAGSYYLKVSLPEQTTTHTFCKQ